MKSIRRLFQRQHWRALYEREWPSLPLCFAAGIALAAIWHLLTGDNAFHTLVASKETGIKSSFDGRHIYSGYAIGIACAVALAVLPWLVRFIVRAWRTWSQGVMYGLRAPAVVCGFAATYFIHPHPSRQAIIYSLWVFCLLLISALTREQSLERRIKTIPTEEQVRVPDDQIQLRGTKPLDSSEPIEDWSADIVNRVSVINALTFSLLIARSPVIALFASLGAGKTSVLNLLKKQLTGRAIVVSFSAWLPGSEDALVASLFSDIA